ncbi:MAG: TonB-dependent receptor, partial [Bacteroidia bacterium]|nr:TonB-dependent receptor [Bacteroidia bacterium]
ITISGYVSDAENGERLTGVTIVEINLKTGVSTDEYGFYTLNLPSGKWDLQLTYIGYKTIVHSGQSLRNTNHDFTMEKSETQLGEVIIEAKRTDENVRAPAMGMVKLDVKTIKSIPSLLGEIDVVRVLQLLPGVQSTSEGSTGFSVRGGGSDQNLILLDDASVYNSGHMLGFFSIFNNDAVKNVTLYKGDIPAAYGGRLSSLLDVEMKEGDPHKTGVTGSIGTISSKLTIDGPIIKDRTTFILGGRRTYADLFLPFAKEEDLRDNKIYFWDMNLKMSHVLNEKNRLFLTGYSGKDVFKDDFARISFGNTTGTLRWNHIFSGNLFMNLSMIYSRYNYDLGTPESGTGSFSFLWKSHISDYQPRLDFTHLLTDKHKLRYGVSINYHEIFPGEVSGIGSTTGDTYFRLPSSYALESGVYLSDEYKVAGNLTLKYGLRFSMLQNIGPGTSYEYDSDYIPVDSISYPSGKIFNTYTALEPRFAFTYLLNDISSVKGSYSHTAQFITLAQNSSSGTPLNIWFPASPNVEPQLCDQFSVGYFRNLRNDLYEISGEVYYKNFRRLIDFRDHAELFLNQYLEAELRRGSGYSYGIEALIRKNEGFFTGWLSYTYSRSFRIVPEINNGNKYPSLYDKPHSVNLVTSFALTKRIAASTTWTYATGLPLTLPTGRAILGNSIIPVYSDRNSYRMEDYHRLDLSVTFKGKEKAGKKWHSELNLSVYNVYNRHNAWAINIVPDETDPFVTYAEKTYLFAVIPAITWNIRF